MAQPPNPYAAGLSLSGVGPNGASQNYQTEWNPQLGTYGINTGAGFAPIYNQQQFDQWTQGAGQLATLPGMSNEGFTSQNFNPFTSMDPGSFTAGDTLGIKTGTGSQNISYRLDPQTGDYIPTSAQGLSGATPLIDKLIEGGAIAGTAAAGLGAAGAFGGGAAPADAAAAAGSAAPASSAVDLAPSLATDATGLTTGTGVLNAGIPAGTFDLGGVGAITGTAPANLAELGAGTLAAGGGAAGGGLLQGLGQIAQNKDFLNAAIKAIGGVASGGASGGAGTGTASMGGIPTGGRGFQTSTMSAGTNPGNVGLHPNLISYAPEQATPSNPQLAQALRSILGRGY